MYYKFIETMNEKASISVQKEGFRNLLQCHYIHDLAGCLIKTSGNLQLFSLSGAKQLVLLFAYGLKFKILALLIHLMPMKGLIMVRKFINKVDAYILDFIAICDLRPCGPLNFEKKIRVTDFNAIAEILEIEHRLRINRGCTRELKVLSGNHLWRTHIIVQVIEVRKRILDSFEKTIQGVFYNTKMYIFFLWALFFIMMFRENISGSYAFGTVLKLDLYLKIIKILVGVLIHVYGIKHLTKWKRAIMMIQKNLSSQNKNSISYKKISKKIEKWETRTALLGHYYKVEKETMPVGHAYLCMAFFALLKYLNQ
ncbi:hypothetical protein [Fusibacter sp. JL216-2]|uniref:hypothetical protein n=1 Tax=Fusibacter sp. JL216-2 TaxID=3071453 RepID=UPI003D328A2C